MNTDKLNVSLCLKSKTIQEIDKIANEEHRNRSQQVEHILSTYVNDKSTI